MYAIRSYYDLIGTLVEHGRRAGRPSTIVSRDKDLTQLLTRDDVFWDFAGKGKLGYDRITSYNVCYTKLLRVEP